MAVQVAFVNDNGDVIHIMSPGTDTMYTNGAVYAGNTAWHIDINDNPATFISTKYFDFDLNTFMTRSAKPSNFHNWNKASKFWEFDFNAALGWIRIQRTQILLSTDWTQLLDVPLTEQQKLDWQVYRQALRDLPDTIPNTIQNIDEIVWPTPPA